MQQSINNSAKAIPKVCVLLSSYNGEKYIKTQIDSILCQEGVKIELVIRDDGSQDATIDIIRSYGDRIRLITGSNRGCEQSFAELLTYQSDADYYAFSDQDDFWIENKVRSEVDAIKNIDGPALAACNLFLCEENLIIDGILHSKENIKRIRQNMHNDYLCNMHGCVLLWNKELHSRLCKNVPEQIVSHDGWVNTVANSIGTTIVLDEALIKYRIHGENVSGHASSIIERAIKGIKLYFGKKHPKRDVIAKEIIKRFSEEINHESNGYDTLLKIANYKYSLRNKIQLLNKDIIKRSPFPDRLLWGMCVIFETY